MSLESDLVAIVRRTILEEFAKRDQPVIPEAYKIGEAAKAAAVSIWVIRGAIQRGELRAVRYESMVDMRIRRADLLAWLDNATPVEPEGTLRSVSA